MADIGTFTGLPRDRSGQREAIRGYLGDVLSGKIFGQNAERYKGLLEGVRDRDPGAFTELTQEVLPLGGLAGIMAGPMAKTANPAARKMAEYWQGQGRSPTDIWRGTGKRYGQSWWLEHPDQVPRFEIPDEMFKFLPERLHERTVDKGIQRHGRLGSAVWHPGLTEAYPELRDARVLASSWQDPGGLRGQYHPPMTAAGISAPEAVLLWGPEGGQASTLLHELQHAVQRREGMARGGSPGDFNLGPAQARQQYRRLGGEMDARAVQARQHLGPQERLDYPFWFDYDLPLDEMILRR